jgi:pimeloyl-ACP methyl ester carboxylesterase
MILHSNIFPNKSENSKIEYLLILHGFLGMSDNWKSLAVQFSENGFDVHVLDLRNHGKSFQTDDFSYDLMVDDVLRYCEYHQIQKTNIIGHSMGGKLAMFLAIQNQNLVEKLVIADIAPKYYEPHHEKILIGLQAVPKSTKFYKIIFQILARDNFYSKIYIGKRLGN